MKHVWPVPDLLQALKSKQRAPGSSGFPGKKTPTSAFTAPYYGIGKWVLWVMISKISHAWNTVKMCHSWPEATDYLRLFWCHIFKFSMRNVTPQFWWELEELAFGNFNWSMTGDQQKCAPLGTEVNKRIKGICKRSTKKCKGSMKRGSLRYGENSEN